MPDGKVSSQGKQYARQADWNMAEKDLQRYDNLLTIADKLAIEIRLGDPSHIHEYFSVLYQIYDNFRPISKINREEDDKVYENMEIRVLEIKNKKGACTYQDLKDLLSLHRKLLEMRQRIGLGMPTSQKFDEKDRMRKSVE